MKGQSNTQEIASNIIYNDSTVESKLDSLSTEVADTVSKANGGTFGGNVVVDRKDGTSTNIGTSWITIGNTTSQGNAQNSRGVIYLVSNTDKGVVLTADDITTDKNIKFPDKSGTVLLDADIKIVKAQSFSSNNAVIAVPSTYPYATFEIVTPLMVYVGSCGSTGAVSDVKGVDGTTPAISGNNVTVPVGSYYKTAVLKLYTSAAF